VLHLVGWFSWKIVCGYDCWKGTFCHLHFVTVSGSDRTVTVSRFLGAVTASTLCRHYHSAAPVAFVTYFKITVTCSVLLCLHVDQPASGSEEGEQSGDTKYWKFMLCYVCSQLGAGQGNTSPWLGSNVMSPWGIRCSKYVSFKNKLLFHKLYIFLDFTFILNAPLRKVKSAFHDVSLPTNGLEGEWTES